MKEKMGEEEEEQEQQTYAEKDVRDILYPKDNYTMMMEATKLDRIGQKKRRAAMILDEEEEPDDVPLTPLLLTKPQEFETRLLAELHIVKHFVRQNTTLSSSNHQQQQ